MHPADQSTDATCHGAALVTSSWMFPFNDETVNWHCMASMIKLSEAVQAGCVDEVKRLLDAGVLSNRDSCLQMAVHDASQQPNPTVMQLLLQAGADANMKDCGLPEPLLTAAQAGHTETVAVLLRAGADISAQDTKRRTPLHLACRGGHAAVVQQLLDAGSSTSLLDEDLCSPLYAAAQSGSVPAVSALLAASAALTGPDAGINPLHGAVRGGSTAVLQLLLSAGAKCSPQVGGEEGLVMTAAMMGRAAFIPWLVAAGASPHERDDFMECTPLMAAAERGHSSAVEVLLQLGADVDAVDVSGRTAVMLAAMNGHRAVVTQLLAAGARADVVQHSSDVFLGKKGASALSYAAERDDPPLLQELLAAAPDPECAAQLASEALLHAAKEGAARAAEALLAAAADPTYCNDEQETALHHAAAQAHPRMVELLLRAGASVSAARFDGATPLWAAVEGHMWASTPPDAVPATVQLLLAAGAAVDVVAGDPSSTALYGACFRGNTDVARLLLSAGASVSISNAYGYSPLTIAAYKGHTTIVKMLLQAGASILHEDHSGNTPLDVVAAADYYCDDTIRALLEWDRPRLPLAIVARALAATAKGEYRASSALLRHLALSDLRLAKGCLQQAVGVEVLQLQRAALRGWREDCRARGSEQHAALVAEEQRLCVLCSELMHLVLLLSAAADREAAGGGAAVV